MPRLESTRYTLLFATAVCVVCGRPATKSQRLIRSEERVVVGGGAIYEPRCRACFDPSGADSRPG